MSRGSRKLGVVVSNASPLDFLAKIGRLDILKAFTDKVIIPKQVYAEIVEKAAAQGFPSANVLQREVDGGWIEMMEPPDDDLMLQLSRVRGIHLGEAQAIRLAKAEEIKLILVDDRLGADLAEVEGLQPMGTIALLIYACVEKYVDFSEFMECLSKLEAKGFWLRPMVQERAVKIVRDESTKQGRGKEMKETFT